MATVTYNDFSGGVNQYLSPELLKDEEIVFGSNITLDNIGNVGHRLGDDLIGDSDTSTNIGVSRGGAVFNKSDDSNELLRVNGGDLEGYNTATDDWDEIQTNIYNSASNVEFANHNQKIYMIGSGDTEYLKSYDGTTVATVSGNIAGKYLAAGSTRLCVGNDQDNNQPQRIYYSETLSETFDTDNDFIDLDDPVSGIVSLGESAPFLGFTKFDMYIFDPDTGESRKISGFGCTSHRSIKVIQGNAIWLSYEGIFRFSGTEAYPVKISDKVENWNTYDAVFNQISGTGFTSAAAGVWRNKYFISLGNLSSTVLGETLNDCWLVYDIHKRAWTIETHTPNGAGAWFDVWVNTNNIQVLVSGSRDNRRVYQIHKPSTYTDDNSTGAGQAVTATMISKLWEFGGKGSKYSGPEDRKNLDYGYMKLSTNTDLDIDVALDGASSFSDWSSTGITPAGFNWNRIQLSAFQNNDFYAMQYKLSGSGNWLLYEFSADIVSREDTEIKTQ